MTTSGERCLEPLEGDAYPGYVLLPLSPLFWTGMGVVIRNDCTVFFELFFFSLTAGLLRGEKCDGRGRGFDSLSAQCVVYSTLTFLWQLFGTIDVSKYHDTVYIIRVLYTISIDSKGRN